HPLRGFNFRNGPVPYYSLLERYEPGVSPFFTWGLPAGLVSRIEKYPLDLTYMKSHLRQYQIFGAKYFLQQRKALLGDEMGLGKTIQALAAVADLTAKGRTHFLVVCPASVLINWKRETEKHSEINAIIVHGHDKEQQLWLWKREGGLCITNYETLLKVESAINFKYGALIVDEAHFVKNPLAQRTVATLKAAKKTDRVLFMTGTPLENRVDEMCFLTECLRPDIAKKLRAMKTLNRTQKFKEKIAPVYLRRIRNDVLEELPELIEKEDWIKPSSQEINAYRLAVISGNFMAMRRVSWDVALHRSSKAKRLAEICNEAQANDRKVLVFSFFRGTLDLVCKLLKNRALGPITGSTPASQRQRLIDQFTAEGTEKVLVSQIQAGGTGLNIQAASVIIICEPQVKPSLETQAISRAYRMGQIQNVIVHRLLCVGTIDERMNEMLKRKQLEFDTYADESLVGQESLKKHSESAWIKRFIEEERVRIAGSMWQSGHDEQKSDESGTVEPIR
ncbi:MAG TPA: DEAD/DEAH box helicase, partial [Firmicutes bacterium]|nr:DEAD/DEAH box helicase [Bacillota bacterium]